MITTLTFLSSRLKWILQEEGSVFYLIVFANTIKHSAGNLIKEINENVRFILMFTVSR